MIKNKVRIVFLITILIGLVVLIGIPNYSNYIISAKSSEEVQSQILRQIHSAQRGWINSDSSIDVVIKSWDGNIIYDPDNLFYEEEEKDESIKLHIENGFIFDECLNPILNTANILNKLNSSKNKPFITPEGDQTKLINDVLLKSRISYRSTNLNGGYPFTRHASTTYDTLNENGDWFYFIAHNYLSPGSSTKNYLICAESKIYPTRYCLDGSDDYEMKIITINTNDRLWFSDEQLKANIEWYQLGKWISFYKLSKTDIKDMVILFLLLFAIFKVPKFFTTYFHKNNHLEKGNRLLLKSTYILVALITISFSVWMYILTAIDKNQKKYGGFIDVENEIENIHQNIKYADRSLDGIVSVEIYGDMYPDPIIMEKIKFLDVYIKKLNKNIVDIKPYINNIDTQALNSIISTLSSGNELNLAQIKKSKKLFERHNYYDSTSNLRYIRNISRLVTIVFIYLLVIALYTRQIIFKEVNKKSTIYLRWLSVFSATALFLFIIGVIGANNYNLLISTNHDIEILENDANTLEKVLTLTNSPSFKNKKKIIKILNSSSSLSFKSQLNTRLQELKQEINLKNTITQSQLKRLREVLKINLYTSIKNRKGLKKEIDKSQSVMLYSIASVFLVVSILAIIFELLTPYRRWLGISTDNKDKVNQYFKWGGVFISVIVITLVSLVTLIKLNPGNYLILSEFLYPLTSMLDTLNTHYRSPKQGEKLQLLLLVPVVFALVAIMVILYAKKQLTRYVIKLAQGEKVDPPKIRLQEFSQIVESIDTLQKRLKGKKYIETFINSIAHEVRTPLAGIRANTESLSLSMDSNNFKQSKNNIIESNDRMLLIINSLLELAKLEQQNKTLEKTRCNINSIIENIINEADIVRKLKDKNINMSFSGHNQCITYANKVLIEMCLRNIINNAVDFSLKDGNIYIETNNGDKNISIKVLDEGVGIPDNMLNKVQEKFISTSRPYTNKRSTGLGLSLVKIIVELHDGAFELQNRKNTQGVFARLTLPK